MTSLWFNEIFTARCLNCLESSYTLDVYDYVINKKFQLHSGDTNKMNYILTTTRNDFSIQVSD